MKRSLLATTAVVAAVACAYVSPVSAQQPPPRAPSGMPGGGTVKLGVGGYMEQVFGFADNKESVVGERVDFDQNSETEVWFKGWARLPNGLTIIADVQLEGNEFTGDQIDESYLIVRGSFGQINLGSENGADNLMTIGYAGFWPTGVGETITFSTDNWIARPTGTTVAASPKEIQDVLTSGTSIDNDSEKITYFTPRFFGFQLGASYIPENAQDTDAIASTAQYHEGYSLGANYNGTFQGGSFGVAAGYITFDAPSGTTLEDPEAWIVAARVFYGPFRIAAAYKEQNDMFAGGGAVTSTALDGKTYTIGAQYSFGQYRASVGYMMSERAGSVATAGDDEFEVVQAAIATDLARGVKVFSALYYGGYREEAGAENDDAWAINAGIRLTF